MTTQLSIAIAQINPTVGAVAHNAELVRKARSQAKKLGADLVVYPELCLSAYPPQDLVRQHAYLSALRAAAETLAAETSDGGPAILIGLPWLRDDKIHNAVLLCDEGRIIEQRLKTQLPNYGVFDEKRNFTPGPALTPMVWRGIKLGLMVCEDMWLPQAAQDLAAQGAELLIVPHGSPFRETAEQERSNVARMRCVETGLPLLFVNQIGGQDELVFDGSALAFNVRGDLVMRAPRFVEGVYLTRWEKQSDAWTLIAGPNAEVLSREEKLYRACVLGLHDYVRKNHFKSVILGLSGGVDSALVAAMAADALGPDNVHCVMLPSKYTSPSSLKDAGDCAALLGVRLETISIAPGVEALDEMLAPAFAATQPDITEENIQSRLRGVALMALSNKFGHLLLTTGNKSEMAVGYATLYGDMNGGFNPLKDLYKMDVYALCRWRNAHHGAGLRAPAGNVIPESIITKAPSAELRPDQKDQDSLPPYEILDEILRGLIEREESVAEITAQGFERALVERIQHLLYIAEYKRNQSPPGPKVSTRNLGRDRRFPMTNGWREKN